VKFTLRKAVRRKKSTDKFNFVPEEGAMDLKDVRLVVTDMDGTLLDSHHRVSDRFFKLQEALSRRGVRFAAASGRQYQSIAVKLTHILEEVFIIAENGGLLRHRDEELLSTPLDPALRDEVLTTLEGIHCGVMGGTIEIIVRNFAGVRLRDNLIEVNPHLPPEWTTVQFSVTHQKRQFDFSITRDSISVQQKAAEGADLPDAYVQIGGHKHLLESDPLVLSYG